MRFSVTGLFIIAILVALYVGKVFILPIALAALLSFVFRPLIRCLALCHIPHPLGAFFVISIITSALSVGVYALSEPAEQWLKEAPGSLRQLQYRIGEWSQPVRDARAATAEMRNLGNVEGGKSKQKVVLEEKTLDDQVLDFTTRFAVGLFTTLFLLFFILGWGERLYRNLVNAQEYFSRQRQIVHIVRDIEKSVSSYLLTITIINILLGVVVALTLYGLDVPNAALWGVVTTGLNYIPYLGPAVTAGILSFVALLTFDTLGEVLLVPLVFLTITTIEGYIVTPLAVGKRLSINPLLIFLSLIFWFALWGFAGAILTVPILVCLKVALQHIDATRPYASILD